MNRRGFFGRLAALAAASATPSVLRAAEPTPAETLTNAANEIHRKQSAGPSFIGMPLDQLVAELRGDHPIEHQRTETRDGNVSVTFVALRTCCYKPPAWLDIGSCTLVIGDTVTILVCLRTGRSASILGTPL
jgi:hypothetical protein